MTDKLSLLFIDAGCVAVNKPPGLVCHAAPGLPQVVPEVYTLLAQAKKPTAELYLVHRLDKETSGVLLLATNAEKAAFLSAQFRRKTPKKVYLALCHGLAEGEFREEAALSELNPRTGRVSVQANGRKAITEFRVLGTNATLGVSLIACYPETGRSHQLRVHLQLRGFPIVGDKHYSEQPLAAAFGATIEHHLLHAQSLRFATGKKIVTVTAPLPRRFVEVLTVAGFTALAQTKAQEWA